MLKYDNRQKDDRIMIFTLVSLLNFLSSCFQWHIDGTFKSCSNKKVISIHGIKKHMGNDQSVLCAQILLKTKKRESCLSSFNRRRTCYLFN
jgi:hypothetical protein